MVFISPITMTSFETNSVCHHFWNSKHFYNTLISFIKSSLWLSEAGIFGESVMTFNS